MSLQTVKLNLSFHSVIPQMHSVHKVICKFSFSTHSSSLISQGVFITWVSQSNESFVLKRFVFDTTQGSWFEIKS